MLSSRHREQLCNYTSAGRVTSCRAHSRRDTHDTVPLWPLGLSPRSRRPASAYYTAHEAPRPSQTVCVPPRRAHTLSHTHQRQCTHHSRPRHGKAARLSRSRLRSPLTCAQAHPCTRACHKSLWPVTSGSQVAPTSPHPRPFPHNNGRRGLELLASPRGSALLPSPRMQTLATASSLPPLTRTAPTAHHPSPHLLPLPRCCPAAAGRSRLAHRARSARRPFSEARESLATRRPWA